MLRKNKYPFIFSIFLFLLVIGGVILNNYENSEQTKLDQEIAQSIKSSHQSALLSLESTIRYYYLMASSVRSFTESSAEPPENEEMMYFLKDYTSKVNFRDSILLSFLDTNHQFVYTVGPNDLDPMGLTGFNISWFRDSSEIGSLDSIMNIEGISLLPAINLVEGWPAFPFCFNLKTQEDVIIGYMAAVLNTKYLIDEVYKRNNDKNIVHRFIMNDSIDFTGTAIYDRSTIYNEKYDSLYYQNNAIHEQGFTYTKNQLFGQQFKLGTGYKSTPNNLYQSILIYYIVGSILLLSALFVFIRKMD